MATAQVVTYTPEMFDRVLSRCREFPPDFPLTYRSFVDHYYASSDFCRLFLVLDEDGMLLGTQGVEWMPFAEGGRMHRFGFGSNYLALRPGAGAYLYAHWLRSCDAGIVPGPTAHVHRILKKSGWVYREGLHSYFLNRRYTGREPVRWYRRIDKGIRTWWSVRHSLPELHRRVPGDLAAVAVEEQSDYSAELLAFRSAFAFRFAPDLSYLRWRYGTKLPFLTYRVFRVSRSGALVGYVVLQERDTEVVVAHSDGSEPRALAAGVVRSIAKLGRDKSDRREVMLTCSYPAMQRLFEQAGFVTAARWDYPFALGKLRGGYEINVPVSEWLVNAAWGDNGLHPPFKDARPGVKAPMRLYGAHERGRFLRPQR